MCTVPVLIKEYLCSICILLKYSFLCPEGVQTFVRDCFTNHHRTGLEKKHDNEKKKKNLPNFSITSVWIHMYRFLNLTDKHCPEKRSENRFT